MRIQEWLLSIKDDTIREQAINNVKDSTLTRHCKSLQMALNDAFGWNATPEGSIYWHNIYKRVANGEEI